MTDIKLVDDTIVRALRAGVMLKSYGSQPNWSWDYPGTPGGCGLPSELDAAQDALDTIARLPVRYKDWLVYNRQDPQEIEMSFPTSTEAVRWVFNNGGEGRWGVCTARDYIIMMRQD